MASQNIQKLSPSENPEDRDEREKRLCLVADYLAGGSRLSRERFHHLKSRENSAKMERLTALLKDLIDTEAERQLSIWIESHPDRASWKQQPALRKALFHSPGEREAIRTAYELYGCDVCGARDRPHSTDGLCARCYARRAWRRQKAAETLEMAKEIRLVTPAEATPSDAALCP